MEDRQMNKRSPTSIQRAFCIAGSYSRVSMNGEGGKRQVKSARLMCAYFRSSGFDTPPPPPQHWMITAAGVLGRGGGRGLQI